MSHDEEIQSLQLARDTVHLIMKADKIRTSINFTFSETSPHRVSLLKKLDEAEAEMHKKLAITLPKKTQNLYIVPKHNQEIIEIYHKNIEDIEVNSLNPSSSKQHFVDNTYSNEVIENYTHWLLRFDDLIYGRNQKVPALQLYHPKNSKLFGENDRRLLDLKNSKPNAIAHYAMALKKVLPKDQIILLCCAPSSSITSSGGVEKIIKAISGGKLIDGSGMLITVKDRGKKSHGVTFLDEELMQTLEIVPKKIQINTKILLLDDVVTSGQTLRICKNLLIKTYPNVSITCLCIASTDYDSDKLGIADAIVVNSISEALSPLHQQTSNLIISYQAEKTYKKQEVTEIRASNTKPIDQLNSKITHSSRSNLPAMKSLTIKSQKNISRNKISNNSTPSDCFVITAIYDGNHNHINVNKLRSLRDTKISKYKMGKILIKCYKFLGPSLALIVVKLKLSYPLRGVLDFALKRFI